MVYQPNGMEGYITKIVCCKELCCRKEVFTMVKTFTHKDIEDGRKISIVFSSLSDENKAMAMVYLSALRDKEIADRDKEKEKAVF